MVTRDLRGGSERPEREMWRCKQAQRGAGLRALQMEEVAPTKEHRWPLESRKGKDTDPFLERPKGKRPLLTPESSF